MCFDVYVRVVRASFFHVSGGLQIMYEGEEKLQKKHKSWENKKGWISLTAIFVVFALSRMKIREIFWQAQRQLHFEEGRKNHDTLLLIVNWKTWSHKMQER